jgi:hypothetical protein
VLLAAKIDSIRSETRFSHSLTGAYSIRSRSGVASLNQGRAGEVAPACSPAASVPCACVPVSSMMWLYEVRSLRLRCALSKRAARGSR